MSTHILIRDDLPPESLAMLQALYSRSPASVLEHIKKVEDVGPNKFMERYYVGYGHRSIGDCGSTTIFIEGVSLLAAKAIQDWPLYRGQEASTRYMDFSKAAIDDPVGTPGSAEIQSAWMEFYHSAQRGLREHLLAQFAKVPGEKDDVFERAIDARKFDILRAFLPAGATTNLSWHTDLRQAADHLDWLIRHPDLTISAVGHGVRRALAEKYPSSFEGRNDAEAQAVSRWQSQVSRNFTYADREYAPDEVEVDTLFVDDLARHLIALSERPRRAELPPWMATLGSVRSRFLLDFGSFRDLQRHRNGVVRMPLLRPGHGFHPWYLDQLPEHLLESAEKLIRVQNSRLVTLEFLGVPATTIQYYCAMGYRVACEVVQSLPAFIYRVELRTNPSVHPTLRAVAQEEARLFRNRFPEVALHADMAPDTWDTRRGRQTITEHA